MNKLTVGALPSSAEVKTDMSLLVFAWIATLAVSSLPNIVITEMRIALPVPLLWAKLAVLAVCLALTLVWKPARALRVYFAVFAILLVTDALAGWVGTTALWQGWFGASDFSTSMFGSQLLRLGTALVMAVVLWVVYRRRRAYFLSMGEMRAAAAPVRWLGIDRPISWGRLGWLSALCITLGTLAFLVIFGSPSLERFGKVIPLLPVVLALAAINAFSEEMSFRAALLAPLRDAVGARQALLLTAALFGLWHFYGVPYGVIGVALAGFLGWYLGKSMLETKGMFWAWFIHFWQDVAIFTFIAAGSITPGG